MNPNAARTITLGFRPEAKPQQVLSIGLPSIDQAVQGFPRGGITEILGPESSGRTTLLYSMLSAATANFASRRQ